MFASAQFSLYSVKYFKTFLQVFPADMLKITTFLFWSSPVVLGFVLSPVFRESGAILSWFCACQASDSATWRMAQQTLRNTNGSRTAGSMGKPWAPTPPIFFFLRMFFWTCFWWPLSLLVFCLTLSLSLWPTFCPRSDAESPFCTSGPELGWFGGQENRSPVQVPWWKVGWNAEFFSRPPRWSPPKRGMLKSGMASWHFLRKPPRIFQQKTGFFRGILMTNQLVLGFCLQRPGKMT